MSSTLSPQADSSGPVSSITMSDLQKILLKAAIDDKVLQFRPVTLKSGRISPYFFDSSLFFSSDSSIDPLGPAFVHTIISSGYEFDVVFGPAYKGIPLATIAYQELRRAGVSVKCSYNRKEAKQHGEGGSVSGCKLMGKRVLIIDDVMTAGTAILEAVQIIQREGGTVAGVVVVLDRQELAPGSDKSTVEVMQQQLNVKVKSLIKFEDVIEASRDVLTDEEVRKMEEYRDKYGASRK